MTDHDDIDMLAAEYVLGTLDAEERAESPQQGAGEARAKPDVDVAQLSEHVRQPEHRQASPEPGDRKGQCRLAS